MGFVLIDSISTLQVGKLIEGRKCVSINEAIFVDHFPGLPVFPGTLLIEAMAQLSGCLLECSVNQAELEIRRAVLVQVERAKFYRPVVPGDTVEIKSQILSLLEGAAQVDALASVQGDRVAIAQLTFTLLHIKSEAVHEQRRRLYKLWMEKLEEPIQIR